MSQLAFRPHTEIEDVARRRAALALALVLAAFALQGLHFTEDLAQVIQLFILQLPVPTGHRILGAAFDTEWLHLGYKAALFALLAGVALVSPPSPTARPARTLLVGAVALQGYHLVEHVVKVTRQVASGCDPCAGPLGAVVNVPWLRFLINLGVLAPTIAALLGIAALYEPQAEAVEVISR